MTDHYYSNEEIERRLTEALEVLERQVQHGASHVAQLLCPVPGYDKEWSAICKLHDQIKKRWYQLAARMGGVCSGQGPRTTHHIRETETEKAPS